MTDKPTRQLSRRDALKLLGAAAGASVLANLPSKWSTPALTAGVLPAHAQTSGCTDSALVFQVIASEGTLEHEYSPNPDSDSGGPLTEGYQATWACGDRCVAVAVGAGPGESGTLRFTVMNGVPFDVPLPAVSIYWIYLNAGTGVYNTGTTLPVTVAGCPTLGAPT